MNFFKRLFGKVEVEVANRGSAFVRVALHEAEVLEAKGKVIALDAANAVAQTALDLLASEAARVHKAQDEIAARRAQILSVL